MHRIPLLLFFASLTFACGQEPEIKKEEDKIQEKPQTPDTLIQVEKKDSHSDYPRLNKDNAEEFLLDFFEKNPERKIKLSTPYGDIKIRLYEKTPVHSANFLMLTKRGYLNDTEFTRIVKDFIVQGGNSQSEQKGLERLLIGSYRLQPEIVDEYLHKSGAVAIARNYKGNPDKLSSPYNFFMVHGRTFNEPQLMAMERDNNISIPEWKREIYRTTGGAPHLDGEHTVFGEIYEGLDVLDKLANVETDDSEWPKEKLSIKAEVIED